MKNLAQGEDALLFKKNNTVYRYTKTSSQEAAGREIDICAAAAKAGIFPMIGMPVYDEDTGILEIKMINMDGTFSDLKKKIEAKGGEEAEELYQKIIDKLKNKIRQMNNLGICHGDLTMNPKNIMYKEVLSIGIELYIIDFTTAKRNVKDCTNLNLNKNYYGFRRLKSRISNKTSIGSTARSLF
jgi:tRNA A-37 threonylcarbamoyl transferase component Bud32